MIHDDSFTFTLVEPTSICMYLYNFVHVVVICAGLDIELHASDSSHCSMFGPTAICSKRLKAL